MAEAEGAERWEIMLGPEHVELTERGELVIRSERVQEMLTTVYAEPRVGANVT